ncbi:hypothetical protein [Sediminicoccus sp. KRV36]|uniref:hypothetical protein n=1 Tax=Sediminicoccus sp. KRV36 TaxID=3133721 RepID=UPI00200DDC5D|nr:hypothetical protein [Sediminicoccus rosea]UPY35926.1 hypothetical protein LHU95_17120 [Sediminicoccus rosea]
MHRVFLAALLMATFATPASAQRTSPHDGIYEGTRLQDCQATGRSGQTRVTGQLRGNRFEIAGLPGDPPLEATVGPNGAVTLPSFGLFGAGTGQIFEGANNARRFTGSHPGRGRCQILYEMRRTSTRFRN